MHFIFYITYYCNKLHLQKAWVVITRVLMHQILGLCYLLLALEITLSEDFASNLARKLYSNAFSFHTTKPSYSLSLWVNANTIAKVQNVCEGVHACVCTREGGLYGVLL